jgi:ribosome modulation factor
MKEYDLDSYGRKWRQTHGFYRMVSGELRQGNFMDFFLIGDTKIGVELVDPNGGEHRYVLENPSSDYEMAKIEYYPVASGWYVHRNGYALLTRKHIRGYQQGLSTNNHDLCVLDTTGVERPELARFNWCDFLKRPEMKRLDPALNFGIMSDQVWWKDRLIYFLNRVIGTVIGNQVVLESKPFLPYIRPLVEDKCQIS